MKRLIAEDEEQVGEITEEDKQQLLNASAKVLEIRKNATDLLDMYKT